MGKVLATQAWRATLEPQHPCQKAGRSGAHLQSQGQEVETGEFLGLTVLANQPTSIGKLGVQ